MIVLFQLKTGKQLAIRHCEVAAIEQREDCCWIYLKSGVGFEVKEDYSYIMEMMQNIDCETWDSNNYDSYMQRLHHQ